MRVCDGTTFGFLMFPFKPSDLSVSELGASNFQFRYAIHVALASLRRSSVFSPDGIAAVS